MGAGGGGGLNIETMSGGNLMIADNKISEVQNKRCLWSYFCFLSKYYQNEIWSNTSMRDISNIFLAQFCRPGPRSRPLYDFIKMAI